MINEINQNYAKHIITIEDPIEYELKGVNQVSINEKTGLTFAYTLRSVLRQDPDVILVGEMRDFDTIQTALMAAETGHLVLSTLHTLDAPETINRIISFFPPYHQQQVRIQLASVLKGIISERLVPKADGKGRVPAVEVLMSTATIRDCITDSNKTKMLTDFIAQGKLHYGMQTFDQSLLELYQNGLVTYEEALKQASNPDDFALKVKGVNNTAEMFEQKQSKDGGGPMIERFAR